MKIVQTSDVHGNFFMRDYVNNRPVKGSLARVYAYVHALRARYGDRLLLFDGGDVLQGSPVVYCSNFVVQGEENLAAGVMKATWCMTVGRGSVSSRFWVRMLSKSTPGNAILPLTVCWNAEE